MKRAVLIRDQRVMRGADKLNALRLLHVSIEGLTGNRQINTDGLNLIRGGDVALIACEVERHADAEAHQHHREHQCTRTAGAPDAEALFE